MNGIVVRLGMKVRLRQRCLYDTVKDNLSCCQSSTGEVSWGWWKTVVNSASSSHLGRSFTVRRCWNQWIRVRSVAWRLGLGRSQQANCWEDRHIKRNTYITSTVTLSAIHTQAAPSLRTSASFRIFSRPCLKDICYRCAHYVYCFDTHFPSISLGVVWHSKGCDCNRIIFSDEFRLNLSSDNNRVRAWRSRYGRLNSVFDVQRHTASTTSGITWSAIVYDTRQPLILIPYTMTVEKYSRDILQPHVLPLMEGLLEAIFQQNKALSHTVMIS
ncbi:transposable element Tcb2 transposase [Trichonephila clavipes]|uniref:Transposable element Tcb2 transposase n=1 Tax=Trichonephila clavipes TaxID=2585209 RepID=A0A8X6SP17_TRICX|nr:transposable element Tcb2 transposase [Trichonephila clavipes]